MKVKIIYLLQLNNLNRLFEIYIFKCNATYKDLKKSCFITKKLIHTIKMCSLYLIIIPRLVWKYGL